MLIPIVNEADEVIGHTDRKLVRQHQIYRVASLWVTNSNGDILLAQRKWTKKQDPGKWGPAVAGTVEEGDTYYETIVREAAEEIGLVNIQPRSAQKQLFTGKHNFFCQVFQLTIDKLAEEFVIAKDEIEQVKWFNRDVLEKQITESPDLFVQSFSWNLENL